MGDGNNVYLDTWLRKHLWLAAPLMALAAVWRVTPGGACQGKHVVTSGEGRGWAILGENVKPRGGRGGNEEFWEGIPLIKVVTWQFD